MYIHRKFAESNCLCAVAVAVIGVQTQNVYRKKIRFWSAYVRCTYVSVSNFFCSLLFWIETPAVQVFGAEENDNAISFFLYFIFWKLYGPKSIQVSSESMIRFIKWQNTLRYRARILCEFTDDTKILLHFMSWHDRQPSNNIRSTDRPTDQPNRFERIHTYAHTKIAY